GGGGAGLAATRSHRAATRWAFSMFHANASSPISVASNRISGARHSRPVSSTMRITRSGAAWWRHEDHTPSASSALTDGRIRAVVRLSVPPPIVPPLAGEGKEGEGATSTVGTPKRASASAATRPAGPPPITAAEVVRAGGRRDADRSGSGGAVRG